MSKEEVLEADGEVVEALPNAFFRVKLADPNFGGHVVLCRLAGKLRKFRIRILLGDWVKIEMSPFDLTRGRIIFRHRGKPPELRALERETPEKEQPKEEPPKS